MTKPIAQTFYINEPSNGVAGVYLTGLDLYFQSKDPTFGVQVQIRQTENGTPTSYVMPFGDVILQPSNVNVSSDASVATNFTFTSPVFLQSATSYALVIIPLGGNPNYNIWTAELNAGVNATDVTTNLPITTNNDTGTLFLSSNDIQFTAVQTEDIKFTLYIAQFKNNTGTAVFTSRNSDYVIIRDLIGTFIPREPVVISNSSYDLTRLTISSNTGPFTVGEVLYQANSTGNVATGVISSVNASSIKLSNSTGMFVTSYQVKGATSSANAVVSAVYANVATLMGSNNITVPFTNTFSINQMIYIGTNNRSYLQPSTITAIIDGTTLQLSSNAMFDETDALFGRVRGDGYLMAAIQNADNIYNTQRIIINLDNVTSNTSLNYSNAIGQYFMGAWSGASANVVYTYDAMYNTIIPQFNESVPPGTNNSWSFIGSAQDSNRTLDSAPIPLVNNVELELSDLPRVLMSRSNEYNKLPVGRLGQPSTLVYANMSTGNNKISPIIDTGLTIVNVIGNAIVPQSQLTGYRIAIDNNPVLFNVGDSVIQQNVVSNNTIGTGTVFVSNDNEIILYNITGYFASNVSIMQSTNNNINATPTSVSFFGENTNANFKYGSRYISKNVVLSPGQDAEDLQVYLTAYRPANTDFLVYAKIQHREDPGKFINKAWSLLTQISSPALLSSTVNKNDFIELQYGFPSSIELFSSSANSVTSNNWINVPSVDNVNIGDYVYLADTTSSNFFTAKVKGINRTTNKSLMLIQTPPFNISNAAFGIIPGLDAINGAFRYSANNNTVRYVSGNLKYVVYDSYLTFAIKIVPISDTTAVVPRAQDMRAIALQV